MSGNRRHIVAQERHRLARREAVRVVQPRAVPHHVGAARDAQLGEELLHRGDALRPAPGRPLRVRAERLHDLLGHEVVRVLVEAARDLAERLRLRDVERACADGGTGPRRTPPDTFTPRMLEERPERVAK